MRGSRTLALLLAALLIVAILIGELGEKHPYFAFETIPGIYALIALCAGIGFVVIARMAGAVLRKREGADDA